MTRRIALSTAIALLCVAGLANAGPIGLPSNQPIFIKFTNLEQIHTTGGDIDVPDSFGPNGVLGGGDDVAYGPAGNWGVFIVTSIEVGLVTVPNTSITGGGAPPPAFFNNGVQGQVYGIFYDIDITSPAAGEATGGFIDLYWSDLPATRDFVGALPNSATVTEFTTGTFLARVAFASGISALPGVFIDSSCDLGSVVGSCQADSFGNIVPGAGGAWAPSLNTDWFTTAFGTRDIRFSNFFTPADTWDSSALVQGFSSTDPATAFVPEPASLALLGIALGGVGFARRRRKV